MFCSYRGQIVPHVPLPHLTLDALLGDEGLEGSSLRVLGVSKVQDLYRGTQPSEGHPLAQICFITLFSHTRAWSSTGANENLLASLTLHTTV